MRMRIIFNDADHKMEEMLTGQWEEKHKHWSRSGVWKEDDDSYYIKDILSDQYISVDKYTGEVTYDGFDKLIESYLEDGIFMEV